MGYLSLDANERSGFQARELKSVYVDANAVLLKLIFHQCHANNFNVFKQIGLIGLYCLGEPVAVRKQQAQPQRIEPAGGQLDPETAI